MLFSARLEKADPLKKLVYTLLELVPDVELDISPDEGLRIFAMDPSHISVVDYQALPDAFSEFSCKSPIRLRVSLGNLLKALKCVGSDHPLTLDVESAAHLQLRSCDTKTSSDREFKLSLMEADDDAERLELPGDDSYPQETEFNADELLTTVKDLASIGDSITLYADERSALRISTTGDIGSASIRFDNIVMDGVKAKAEIGTYASRFLVSITRTAGATDKGDSVHVHLSVEMPMLLRYKIAGGFGTVRYFLAPKVFE